MNEQFDLAIIGAGPGGYSTALRAAELGMSVALIERDATVGGTCLSRGCIPSKALITATHTIDTVHRAAELGVNASVNGIDFGTLRDYRLRVVDTMVKGLAGLLAHRNITVLRADASFNAEETDAADNARHIVHLAPSPGQTEILTYHKADVPEPTGIRCDYRRWSDRSRICLDVERGRFTGNVVDSQESRTLHVGSSRRHNVDPRAQASRRERHHSYHRHPCGYRR